MGYKYALMGGVALICWAMLMTCIEICKDYAPPIEQYKFTRRVDVCSGSLRRAA